MAPIPTFPSVLPIASSGPAAAGPAPDESQVSSGALWGLLPRGQMLEISGTRPGKLSTAVRLLLAAQAEGETTAWIAPREGSWFFPPDFAQAGVDLSALVVVRVPAKLSSLGCVRSAELLLRSGAWGLVIIDFSQSALPQGALAWQARLSALSRSHGTRIVLLTQSDSTEPSLGPLVSLRVEPVWTLREGGRRAVLTPRILKNKLGRPCSLPTDDCHLPAGAAL